MTELLIPPKPVPTETTFRLHAWRDTARVALLLMEAAWIGLLYTAFSRLGEPVSYVRALGILGGGLFAAHFVALWLSAWRIRLVFRRVVLGLLVLLWLWAGSQILVPGETWLSPAGLLGQTLSSLLNAAFIPGRFWAAAVILLVWLRGVNLAAHELDGHVVLRSFQTGMLACGVTALLAARVLRVELLAGIFLYTAAGLAALSASRVYAASIQRTGRRTRFGRSWGLGLGGAILGVVALGYLLSALFPAELVRLAGQILGAVLLVLFGGVVFLFALLVDVLIQLLQRLNYNRSMEEFSNIISNLVRQLPEPQETLADVVPGDPLRLGLTVAGLAILLLLVVLALRWRPHLEPLTPVEETEDLQPSLNPAAALRARLRAGIEELRRRLGGVAAGRLLAAARVRWVYARLMSQSARLGQPRPASVTPLEFLPGLEEVFPGCAPDLQVITRAYLAVRYGELPEDPAQVQEVTAAWGRVRGAGRKLPPTPRT